MFLEVSIEDVQPSLVRKASHVIVAGGRSEGYDLALNSSLVERRNEQLRPRRSR